MSSSINRRIIDKINQSEYDENIKNFLKSILNIELRHSEEGYLRYGREYDRCIQKVMMQMYPEIFKTKEGS